MRAKQAAVVRSGIGSGTDSGGTPCEGLELRLFEASVDCPGFRGGTAQVVLLSEQPWVMLQDHASSRAGKPVRIAWLHVKVGSPWKESQT